VTSAVVTADDFGLARAAVAARIGAFGAHRRWRS
jgi:hypothetical protein